MAFRRSAAHKLRLSDVVNAEFVKGSDIEHPNYIKLHGKEIIRVNVLGKVSNTYHSPESNYASLTIQELDDENIKTRIKLFGEETIFVQGIVEGDLVKTIGKVREDEIGRFILGEAIRKIDSKHVELRGYELEKFPEVPGEAKPKESDEKLEEEKQETESEPEKLIIEDTGKV